MRAKTLRSTALAYKDERDEVPMSSQEVLEANVAAIRGDLKELKSDFRAAVTRLDQRIDAAVLKLEAEIRAMAAKAERELREFAGRIEKQIDEMRADDKALRDKIDKTNEKLGELARSVDSVGSKLTAFFWVVSILATIIGALVAAGKAFHWF